MHLEAWLFETVVPCMTRVDFDHAEALIGKAMRSGEVEDWGERDWRFPEALYRASGHRIGPKLLRPAHDDSARYVSRVVRNLTALRADKQGKRLRNIV